MTEEYKASEVLEDAADYIEEHGWTQHAYVQPTGQVCSVGAIFGAVGAIENGRFAPVALTSEGILASRVAQKALGLYVGSGHVPNWNDHPERTKQEVLDAFRGAAKHERIREEGLE